MTTDRMKKFRERMALAAYQTGQPDNLYSTFNSLISAMKTANTPAHQWGQLWREIATAYRNKRLSDAEFDQLLTRMP